MTDRIRRPDDDLITGFKYNPQEGLKLTDIHNVLALVPGENDGPNWHWVVQLCDGRFAYIVGGCDYTGWDCGSHLEHTITKYAEEAAALAETETYYEIKKPISQQLLDQLLGKQPFGVKEV